MQDTCFPNPVALTSLPRLMPTIPNLVRVLPEDVTLKGYFIPAGVSLIPSNCALIRLS